MALIYKQKAKVSDVVIDKISIVLGVDDKYHHTIKEQLAELLSDHGYKITRPRYKFSARIFLEYPDICAEVSICPKHPSYPFFRVEFNPAAGCVQNLKGIVDQILPGGYEQLVEGGKCTRIDAAVDVYGIDINDLIILYPKMRKTKGFYNNGKLETYTLGIKYGETEICVYDKAAQIKMLNEKSEIKLPIPKQPITRIEVRKKKGYLFKEIASVPNFFEGIQISSYFSFVPVIDKEKFSLFLEVCRSRGAVDALKMLNETNRERYRKLIQSCKLIWWNPQKIWDGWKCASAILIGS